MHLLRLANCDISLRNGKRLLPTRLSYSVYLTANLNLIIFLHLIAHHVSFTEQEPIGAEISVFLENQIIEHCQPETGEIVSPIFLRPKQGTWGLHGYFRFEVRSLNQAVTYHKFKMDTLEYVLRLMKPQWLFMSYIDLRNATIQPLYHLASENISCLGGGVFCSSFVPYPLV